MSIDSERNDVRVILIPSNRLCGKFCVRVRSSPTMLLRATSNMCLLVRVVRKCLIVVSICVEKLVIGLLLGGANVQGLS